MNKQVQFLGVWTLDKRICQPHIEFVMSTPQSSSDHLTPTPNFLSLSEVYFTS